MHKRLLSLLPVVVVVGLALSQGASAPGLSPYDRFMIAGKPVAQVGVPVFTEFKVDETRREDCEPSPRGDLCIEQSYGNLSAAEGPLRALESMRDELRAGSLTIDQCHFITHNIGFGAVIFYDRDFAQILNVVAPDCSEGYLHGTFVPFFSDLDPGSAPALASRAADLCSDENTASEYALSNCGHGSGHAIVLRSGYNLPLAIETCALAWPDRGRVYTNCLQGVFMENFIPSHGVRSPWVVPDDLVSPCTVFTDQIVADACFVQLGDRLALTPSLGIEGFASLCGSLAGDGAISNPANAVDRCFYGLGRHVAMRGGASSGSPTALELCAVAAKYGGEPICIAAYATSNVRLVRGIREPGDSDAARLCRTITAPPLRDACWWGVGKAMLDNSGAEYFVEGFDPIARCRDERVAGEIDLASCARGLSGLPYGRGTTI